VGYSSGQRRRDRRDDRRPLSLRLSAKVILV
jgi:hypothetical protein